MIAMTMQVRRIVTGHDDFGKGVVVTDEVLTAVSRGMGPHIEGCEIWSTNAMPLHEQELLDAIQVAIERDRIRRQEAKFSTQRSAGWPALAPRR
jgi:hypothetical protein